MELSASSLSFESVTEIKITPGIILVIHEPQKSNLNLSIYSVETGEIIGRYNQFISRGRRIDFVEQFDQYLLIKQERCNLRIINV